MGRHASVRRLPGPRVDPLENALQENRRLRRTLRDMEETLRKSEARKSAILETALDCIITMDRDGKVVDFNPAAESTFGYRRADGSEFPVELAITHIAGDGAPLFVAYLRDLGERTRREPAAPLSQG